MEEAFVKTSIDTRGVAEVLFFSPKSNALPSSILKSLAETIKELSHEERAKIVVIKSQGEKTFCAGASFDELLNISNQIEGKDFFMGFAEVIQAIKHCPKVVISRVQNKVVGGGVGLICASDYAVGTASSAIKLSELHVGIGPFVIGPVVERKMGKSWYAKLALEADWISAEQAFNCGVYAQIFPTVEQVDSYIDQFINHLIDKNPEAISLIKKISWEGWEHLNELLDERAAMSGRLVNSEFTRNYIKRFKKLT